ncbi:MAG: hypothetical protein FWD76_04350 [Firmicutes bacterium]|nr:hypothetical protein [Bacillota bacterium]
MESKIKINRLDEPKVKKPSKCKGALKAIFVSNVVLKLVAVVLAVGIWVVVAAL